MRDLTITSTGVPFLDSLLGGGYLSNSIIVISHQTAVNIWELVPRILLNNFDPSFHLIMVTFHLSLQEYLDLAKYSIFTPKILKDITENLITSLSVIDCFSTSYGEEDSKKGIVHYVSNPFNVDNLLYVMSNVRESVPRDKRVYWIFYNLTNMSIGVPEEELIKFCRRAFRYHKQKGEQAFYFLNESAHTDMFFAKLYQLSDVFIKFIVEETSRGLVNTVQVIKGVFPFKSKKTYFYLNENKELQSSENKLEILEMLTNNSYPTTMNLQIRKFEGPDSKFLKTGIPKLDSLLGGGMLSNSITVASYQYGISILEPLHHIFQNQHSLKTYIILTTYNFSLKEYLTRFKLSEQMAGVIEAPLELFLQGNASVIDCQNLQQNETETLKNVYTLSNPFDLEKLLSLMAKVRNSISEDKSAFWILNSLTEMSIGVPEDDELLKFCRRAFRYHKQKGDLALYILNEEAHSERFRAKLYNLSDVFIKFIAEYTPEGMDTHIQVFKNHFNYNSAKTKYILDKKGKIQFVEN